MEGMRYNFNWVEVGKMWLHIGVGDMWVRRELSSLYSVELFFDGIDCNQ